MADLIQNVQDVFKKWESRGASSFRGRRNSAQRSDTYTQNRRALYSDTFNRPGDRRFRQRDRNPYFKLPKYDGLAEFKMAPIIMTENKQRPFMGSCCLKCLPQSRASVTDSRVFSLSVCNILHIPHCKSLDFNVVLNILKRNQKSSYPDVSSNVLKSERIISAVDDVIDLCSKEYDDDDSNESLIRKMRTDHFQRARSILNVIKSSVSSVCLHLSSFLLHSIFSKMFDGILVHKGQLEILKTVSQDNIPIIYLPLHQNYMDSTMISFILFMNSLIVPLVPMEQDLSIPLFRYILKFVGGFLTKNHPNNYSDLDHILQSAVLRSYILECVKAGYSLEFFINKDISPSSSHYLDRNNFLPAVIESVLKGCIDDAYICVVSTSYEKFIGPNIVTQQLGQPQNKNYFLDTIYYMWKMLHIKFGNVRLNFSQPFSIKEYLQTSKQILSTTIPNIETPPASPTKDGLSFEKLSLEDELLLHTQKNLKRHLLYDATVSMPLMSTHLLSFLLLTQYRKGATQQQLQNSMDWLRRMLSNKNRDVGFTGQSLPVIKRAVEFLGKDLIVSEVVDMEWTSSDLENNNVKVTIYRPVIKLPHILELQYYSSFVIPVFILDSFVVNAIYALVDVEICHFRHCDSQLYVSRDALIDKAIELNDLLQFEFVTIPPCADLSLSFSDTLDKLVEKECLHAVGTMIPGRTGAYAVKTHNLCFGASDDDDDDDDIDTPVGKQQQLKIDLSEESISHLEFLRNVLSPYIESYWLSAITLLKLINEVKTEIVFIQEMQQTAQEKLCKGLLAYEESFSAVTFKNCLKLFECWKVIESYEQDGFKIVYLNENFNNKDQIGFLISKIEEFRK